jgi:hypothetical protein
MGASDGLVREMSQHGKAIRGARATAKSQARFVRTWPEPLQFRRVFEAAPGSAFG